MKEGVVPISQLPPPPMPPQPEMLFTRQPDLEALGHKLAGAGWRIPEKLRGARPRIGRGGRLIFDRWILTLKIEEGGGVGESALCL